MLLTEDVDAPLVHRGSVCAATVLHGGPGLPQVPGYIVTLHRTQLAPPIIPSYGVQVRVHTHQSCRRRGKFNVKDEMAVKTHRDSHAKT